MRLTTFAASEAAASLALPCDNPSLPALAAFDHAAWETLVDREGPRLFKFAYVRVGDAAAAEDIVGEVFEEAARRIGQFEERGAPLSAWLFRVARNLVADHLKRRRRRPVVSLDDEIAQSLAVPQDDADTLADVRAAMRRLTREQQEVVALRFTSGCDLQETAAAMKKSVGAVKVLQHRALKAMRDLLETPGTGEDGLR